MRSAARKLPITFVLGTLVLAIGCGQRSRDEVEAIIAKSYSLQEVNNVCTEFPRPKTFELVNKQFGGNSGTAAIEYQYLAHTPYDSVREFYQDPALRASYEFVSENYRGDSALENDIYFQQGEVSINISNRPPAGIVSMYCSTSARLPADQRYPAEWFAAINDPNKPDWEILPQEARAGEVILSKRNELGILSNFAATPFELDGNRYASVEGFWQMMLYPEGPDDPRAKDKRVVWKFTRAEVAQMTAFDAKAAGTLAEENMKNLGIEWCSYKDQPPFFPGERFAYRSATPGEHYKLILAAMRAKLDQNPEVKRILLATGDLKLRPDHVEEPNAPPEWHYYDIWMQLRSELQKLKR